MSPIAVDLLSGALRPLHAHAWNVQVDNAGLDRLRELNRRHALVFLPSHRSYADPLLLADVLAEHDFPRNHVLGGDNLRFWPVGPLAKRAGVVFIRRSFGDDEVYKLAVRQYFGYLLAKRFNLEWYMEGGRSRTGKLRPPRYGLLAYVAEAIEQGRADDVYLVPVSITYDQLREVSAMAAEQVGAPKKGEGLALARPLRPRPARPGRLGPRAVRRADLAARRARARPGDARTRRLALQKVAFEVCVGINRVTPVIATALVTLALLGVRDRALTLAQVRRVLGPVRELPGRARAAVAVDVLSTDTGVRRVLGALAQQKVVTIYAGGEEPVYAIERGQHLVAAFYRNSAIHHFVDRAIAELVLLAEPEDRWDAALGCATCSSSSSSSRTARPTAPSSPPSSADGRGLGHARRARRAGARAVPHRPPRAALVRRRPARGGAAAGRAQPGHAGRREGVPRRVRRRRAADAPAGTAARAGVAVARAVRERAEARREPRPRRRGRRGAGRRRREFAAQLRTGWAG